ncbi:hypothetical protein B0H67DRAFT_590517 [Lasiosphaeris hirsuta]|uniref:Uncharacterized protein n=1 Tax=Lasiosphaeris hirsuta TaxID=260670 RepID=A0AA40A3J3_9PEZI|nr:hypothetical protein B0H67DRAFT_590517 [Lasiosphaeris hirsuta]
MQFRKRNQPGRDLSPSPPAPRETQYSPRQHAPPSHYSGSPPVPSPGHYSNSPPVPQYSSSPPYHEYPAMASTRSRSATAELPGSY